MMHSMSIINAETMGVDWRESTFFENPRTSPDWNKAAVMIFEEKEDRIGFVVPHKQYRKWYKHNRQGNVWRIIEAEQDNLDDTSVLVWSFNWGQDNLQLQGISDKGGIISKVGWCWGSRYLNHLPEYHFFAEPGQAKNICCNRPSGSRRGGRHHRV